MKKVLLVLNKGFDKSGAPTMIMDIVRGLSKEGYSFDAIYFSMNKAYYFNEFIGLGGKTFLFNNRIDGIKKYYQQSLYYKYCKKIIKENGPYDVIHCFVERKSEAYLRAAKKMGIKTRLVEVNAKYNDHFDFIHRVYNNSIKKKTIKYSTGIATPSLIAGETCYGKGLSYNVIPNTYNENEFTFSDKTPNKLTLVQTAHFIDGKNHRFTLDVFNEIRKMGIDARLKIIGDDYQSWIHINFLKKAKELGLENYIEYENYDCNLKEAYEDSTYFMYPSLSESFGIALLEAQACGLHCFASTDIPNDANAGGVHYLPLSSGAKFWAEEIVKFYQENKGQKEKFDMSKYSNEKYIKAYIDFYNR